jgi:hypothetical protein
MRYKLLSSGLGKVLFDGVCRRSAESTSEQKKEAVCPSETSVITHQSTWCRDAEDHMKSLG